MSEFINERTIDKICEDVYKRQPNKPKKMQSKRATHLFFILPFIIPTPLLFSFLFTLVLVLVLLMIMVGICPWFGWGIVWVAVWVDCPPTGAPQLGQNLESVCVPQFWQYIEIPPLFANKIAQNKGNINGKLKMCIRDRP